MAFIGGEDSVLSNALFKAALKKQGGVAQPAIPPGNGQAGTPSQPANPFYFGPNATNPEATIMTPVQGQPAPIVTPEQAQMGQLQTFLQKLQDPTVRLQLVTMLGSTQPAPQDSDIQRFLSDLGGTQNATG